LFSYTEIWLADLLSFDLKLLVNVFREHCGFLAPSFQSRLRVAYSLMCQPKKLSLTDYYESSKHFVDNKFITNISVQAKKCGREF